MDRRLTAALAIAGMTGIVLTWVANCPSQDAIGTVATIRSWRASQASSNQGMSATASSPAAAMAFAPRRR